MSIQIKDNTVIVEMTNNRGKNLGYMFYDLKKKEFDCPLLSLDYADQYYQKEDELQKFVLNQLKSVM